MHGIREEGLQRSALKHGFFFESLQDIGELVPLFAFSEHLQRVVMVSDILLIDG